jgi:poly(A) polymerase
MSSGLKHSTALVVVIPSEFQERLNYWRSQYDRAFPRWMPHLTLYYPFVPECDFPEIAERIQAQLRGFGSFEVNLNKVSYFRQKNRSTIHLRLEDDTKLQDLFNNRLRNAIPEIPLAHPSFTPHMTLAQTDWKNNQQMIQSLEEYFNNQEMRMTISEIQIISRSETDPSIPFTVRHTISLL